jgi:hypothetical protein
MFKVKIKSRECRDFDVWILRMDGFQRRPPVSPILSKIDKIGETGGSLATTHFQGQLPSHPTACMTSKTNKTKRKSSIRAEVIEKLKATPFVR